MNLKPTREHTGSGMKKVGEATVKVALEVTDNFLLAERQSILIKLGAVEEELIRRGRLRQRSVTPKRKR